MSGEKLKPLVIGHFKSPRPMKGFDPLDLGVQYTYSAKAWMTSVLFKTYLYELNEDLKRNKRKILLLLDNAPSHPCVELSNIELMFLPKNTTSIIQPLDMGIIKALKAHYFNALVDSIGYDMLSQDSDCIHSPNIKDAILLISIAWDNVSKETIKHCFEKGLKENLGCSTTDEVDEKLETLIEFAVEEVYDEALVLEEDETSIEEIVNDTDQRDLIKSALFHFESFYSAAEKLFSSNLKELLILKIEMVREWRKKFGFGSKITDFLIKKNE